MRTFEEQLKEFEEEYETLSESFKELMAEPLKQQKKYLMDMIKWEEDHCLKPGTPEYWEKFDDLIEFLLEEKRINPLKKQEGAKQ